MIYNFVSQFTDTPGGRFKKNGPKSGEEFREDVLIPLIKKLSPKETIHIVLDGAYGYAISFLEEAFGGLVRKLGKQEVLNKLEFECNDEPDLINQILKYINEAEKK